MPVTVKNYAGNICKDNPRLFNILQVSFLKEKADFLKKDIPFPTKEKKIKAREKQPIAASIGIYSLFINGFLLTVLFVCFFVCLFIKFSFSRKH